MCGRPNGVRRGITSLGRPIHVALPYSGGALISRTTGTFSKIPFEEL